MYFNRNFFSATFSETNVAVLLKLHYTLISENDVSKVFLQLELFYTPNKCFLHINEINFGSEWFPLYNTR